MPAVPVNVGVVLPVVLPFAGAVRTTEGATLSILNVDGELRPTLPS
jgi:hypothetical protein